MSLLASQMSQLTSSRAAKSKAERKASTSCRRGGQRHKRDLESSAATNSKVLIEEAADVMDVVRDSMSFPSPGLTPSVPASSGCWAVPSPADSCVSTQPPPSPLELPVAALDSDEWPSLNQLAALEDGWELCSQCNSEGSSWHLEGDTEAEEDDDVEDLNAWQLAPKTAATPQASEELSTKPLFSEVLKQNMQKMKVRAQPSAQRPAPGSPVLRAITMEKRISGTNPANNSTWEEEEDMEPGSWTDHGDLRAGSHGWSRSHKASRSIKQCRKVAERAEVRMQQSCKARGWDEL